MAEPQVSVVIPVHDNAATIGDQLDALARCLAGAPPTELIVVDNRSSDGSASTVRSWSESAGVPVRVIGASERAGEPYARNVGMRTARGRHILYCDGDDVVDEGWIAAMHQGLLQWPRVTGPVTTDRLNDPSVASVRGSAIFEGIPMLYDTIPFAHGCNMGFRREVLHDLRGFDERFLAGCDQVVAIRAWQRGYELGFVPEASVNYRLRPDLRSMARQGRNYGCYRVHVRALTPELVDGTQLRRAALRRILWLGRHSFAAATSRTQAAAWLWVASQMVGEAQGCWERRHG